MEDIKQEETEKTEKEGPLCFLCFLLLDFLRDCPKDLMI
jgi:hypothetical protein